MTSQFPDDPATALLETLIDRISQQDPAALRTLYELTSPRLFGIALLILGRNEWAQDVLRDAFVEIWRSAVQYRHEASGPMAWVTMIARNQAFNYLGQRRMRGASREMAWSQQFADDLMGDLKGLFEMASLKEEAVHPVLGSNKLDARQWRAVTLACLCQLTHAEIAEVMNASPGSVKKWIRFGIQNLRLSLDGGCTNATAHAEN